MNSDLLDGLSSNDFLSTDSDYGRADVASDLYEGSQTLSDRYVNEGQTSSITSEMIIDGVIQFIDIGENGAAYGQVMKWNGSSWVAANDEVGAGGGGWINEGNIVKLETDSDTVGIGTNSPSEKLHVAGNLLVTGKGTIGTGHTNTGYFAFVAGTNNTATGDYSKIGGGASNSAGGARSTIGGGANNAANADDAVVSGGWGNTAGGENSVVAGGVLNAANGYSGLVGGGYQNSADSNYGVIGGGRSNFIGGQYSVIPGGYADTVTSEYSYLFGINSDLTQDSTFMVDMPHIRFGDESTGYEYPASDGSSGQVMATDGSGQLSWTDQTGDGGWADDGTIVRLESDTDSVGIGISTPSEKFEVNGNIKASGTITSGNSISIDGDNSKITSSVGTVDFDDDNLATSGLATLGPGGVLFNTIGPPELPLASFNPINGIMFADTTAGDTVAQYGPGGAVFVQLQPEPPSPGIANYGPGGVLFNTIGPPGLPLASFNPINGIMFADTTAGDTVAQYGPGGAVFVQLQPEPPSPGIANYGAGGVVFNTIGPPMLPVASFNPTEGIMFADTSDGDTVGMYTSEQILLKGDGSTSEPFDVRVEPKGMFFEIETSMIPQTEFSGNGVIMSDAYGDTTVQISNQGGLSLNLDAGATQTVGIGERYRDNAIVAWGNVSGSGALQSDFGVASVTRNYIGDYTITLDITGAGTGFVIPMAVAEVESAPVSASAARLLTINQVGASSFDVYITDGNYNAADNDFLFMVTAR
jgi:hypothetical protein